MFEYTRGVVVVCLLSWGAEAAANPDKAEPSNVPLVSQTSVQPTDDKNCKSGLTFFNKCFLVGKTGGAAILGAMCILALSATAYGMYTFLQQDSYAFRELVKLLILESALSFTSYQAFKVSMQAMRILLNNRAGMV